MNNFLERNYVSRVSASAAAAQTDIDSSRLDLQTITGDEVTFLLALGDVTATSALEIQVWEHTADAAAGTQITASQCTFTAAAADADSKLMAITVKRSKITKRYVYAKIKRGTANAVVDGVFAIVSNPRVLPVTQPSEVIKQAALAA